MTLQYGAAGIAGNMAYLVGGCNSCTPPTPLAALHIYTITTDLWATGTSAWQWRRAWPAPNLVLARADLLHVRLTAASLHTRLPPPDRRCKYAHISRQVQRLLRRHRRQHVLLRRRPNIHRSHVLRGLLRCPCGHFESHTCAVGCSYPVTNCNAQPSSDRLPFAFTN